MFCEKYRLTGTRSRSRRTHRQPRRWRNAERIGGSSEQEGKHGGEEGGVHGARRYLIEK